MKLESAAELAWRRFSRRLPSDVQSVEAALETQQRTFDQWVACLVVANHFVTRVHSGVHRRGATKGRRSSVAWRALRWLAGGGSFTAEQIAAQIGKPHVDVVRRGLKRLLARGCVSASAVVSQLEPRAFTITERGRQMLEEQGEGQ